MGASKDASLNYKAQIETNKTNQQIASDANQFNAMMQDKQNEYNTNMYNQQVEDTWEMWNAENAYNSPSAQRERLEAAGLNPYLMMSGGSAGTAGSMSAPSANSTSPAQAVTIPEQAPQYIDNVQRTMAVLSGISDVLKTTQDANQMYIENQYKAQSLASEIMDKQASARQKRAASYWQEIGNGLANNIWQSQAQQGVLNNISLQQTIQGQVLGNIYQLGANKFQSVEQGMQVGGYISDMLTQMVNRTATKASIDKTLKEIDNLVKVGEGLDIENQIKQNDLEGRSAYDKSYYQQRLEVVKQIVESELKQLQTHSGPDSVWQLGTYISNELNKLINKRPMNGYGNDATYTPGILY